MGHRSSVNHECDHHFSSSKKSCVQPSPPAFCDRVTPMLNRRPILQLLKTVAFVALPCALAAMSRRAGAQPSLLPPNDRSTLPVSTAITHGQVTFSWPVMTGTWELFVQQPPFTGEWKPANTNLYHTNNATVSATLPVPAKATFYRVRRTFALRPSQTPAMPPMPPTITKRATPPKLPTRP